MSIFYCNLEKEKWIKEDRKKTLDLFMEFEYGIRPLECKNDLKYTIIDRKIEDNIILEKVEMKYSSHPMIFYIYLPNNNPINLKTFITVLHPYRDKGDLFNDYKSISEFCPIDEILENGFACILLSAKTIAEDRKGGEYTGIFQDMNLERTDTSWGVLSAWAWACSKILDYISTRSEFNEERVAVVGHSRGGKTALLASALDERFYLTISNNSGNSGAALSRGNTGETVKEIVDRFPYWFCKKYQQFADNENKLPFDQHQFLGLIAPRHCYVASATLDEWADPDGELLSCKLASQYYELFNLKGVIIPNDFKLDLSYNEGMIAYHRRTGNHALTNADWKMYMEYFNKIA